MNRLKKYLTIMLLLGLDLPGNGLQQQLLPPKTKFRPHLKPENPEEPVGTTIPRPTARRVQWTYNVGGVFTKYISDGSCQMIADMMTEGKADSGHPANWTAVRFGTGRVFQLKKFAELMGGVELRIFAGDGLSGRSLRRRNRQPWRNPFGPLPPAAEGRRRRTPRDGRHGVRKYVFATTHLDHVSTLAQAGQVDEINKVIEREFGGSKKPVFLGGDFNARPDSPTISKLKTGDLSFRPTAGVTSPHSQAPNKCVDYILLWNGNGAKCDVVGTKIMLDSQQCDIAGPRTIFPCWSMSPTLRRKRKRL